MFNCACCCRACTFDDFCNGLPCDCLLCRTCCTDTLGTVLKQTLPGTALQLHCPGCNTRVSRALLHDLVPQQLQEWDAAATNLALANYSRCPHPSCGAYIEVVTGPKSNPVNTSLTGEGRSTAISLLDSSVQSLQAGKTECLDLSGPIVHLDLTASRRRSAPAPAVQGLAADVEDLDALEQIGAAPAALVPRATKDAAQDLTQSGRRRESVASGSLHTPKKNTDAPRGSTLEAAIDLSDALSPLPPLLCLGAGGAGNPSRQQVGLGHHHFNHNQQQQQPLKGPAGSADRISKAEVEVGTPAARRASCPGVLAPNVIDIDALEARQAQQPQQQQHKQHQNQRQQSQHAGPAVPVEKGLARPCKRKADEVLYDPESDDDLLDLTNDRPPAASSKSKAASSSAAASGSGSRNPKAATATGSGRNEQHLSNEASGSGSGSQAALKKEAPLQTYQKRLGKWAEDKKPKGSAKQLKGGRGKKGKGAPEEEELTSFLVVGEVQRVYNDFRIRCTMCGKDHCQSCRTFPYHKGFTCEQWAAPKCLYCDEKILPITGDSADTLHLSVPAMRTRLNLMCIDLKSHTKKAELTTLTEHVAKVCPRDVCKSKLRDSCFRRLPGCGHFCCGVRGELRCLPCLEPGCAAATATEALHANAATTAALVPDTGGPSSASTSAAASVAVAGAAHMEHPTADDSCFFCWENLSTGPCIQLGCGHVCHAECGRERLKVGYPGPSISFNFLNCPLCGEAPAAPKPAATALSTSAAAPLSSPGSAAPPTIKSPARQGHRGGKPTGPASPGIQAPAAAAANNSGVGAANAPHKGAKLGGGAAIMAMAAAAAGAAVAQLAGPPAKVKGKEVAGKPQPPAPLTPPDFYMNHPALKGQMTKPLALWRSVSVLAGARVLDEGLAAVDPLLKPGGEFFQKPAEYGMAKMLFFECATCNKPYYGGKKVCGAGPAEPQAGAAAAPGAVAGAAANGAAAAAAAAAAGGPRGAGGAAFDAQHLMCGDCCAKAHGDQCPVHGTEYVEYKCKYCCELASFFCWGTTHFCTACHTRPVIKNCTGKKTCPLGVDHPKNPVELCLGCGLCRRERVTS